MQRALRALDHRYLQRPLTIVALVSLAVTLGGFAGAVIGWLFSLPSLILLLFGLAGAALAVVAADQALHREQHKRCGDVGDALQTALNHLTRYLRERTVALPAREGEPATSDFREYTGPPEYQQETLRVYFQRYSNPILDELLHAERLGFSSHKHQSLVTGPADVADLGKMIEALAWPVVRELRKAGRRVPS